MDPIICTEQRAAEGLDAAETVLELWDNAQRANGRTCYGCSAAETATSSNAQSMLTSLNDTALALAQVLRLLPIINRLDDKTRH
jgi:hypothetical protein